jgi:hypothetical protein
MEFKIIKIADYDEHNKQTSVRYKIKYKTKFLGFSIWKTIKYRVCDWGDCYRTDMLFSKLEYAHAHIKKMCEENRIEFQRTDKKIVDIIKCNDI